VARVPTPKGEEKKNPGNKVRFVFPAVQPSNSIKGFYQIILKAPKLHRVEK